LRTESKLTEYELAIEEKRLDPWAIDIAFDVSIEAASA
jgi:hypothetical protein